MPGSTVPTGWRKLVTFPEADRFDTRPKGIDGMAYMQWSTYSEQRGTFELKDDIGGIRWLHEKGQACFDSKGDLQWLDSAIFDITDRKIMEKKLEETLTEVKSLSLTDELTHLYNRRGFITHADQQLKIAIRNHKPISILFCDLDGMKEINDSLGHNVGDQALILTSSLMRQTFRDADIIAFGHTHSLAIRHNGKLVINPGELGGWLTGRSSFVILDLDTLTPETIYF